MNAFTSSQLGNETWRSLRKDMELEFEESNSRIVCSSHKPPRPSDEEIARLREWSKTEALFAGGNDETTSTPLDTTSAVVEETTSTVDDEDTQEKVAR